MTHLCVSGSRSEVHHELDEIIVKLNQGWNDRLDFPPTKLPERYISKKLSIGLELECEFSPFTGGRRSSTS